MTQRTRMVWNVADTAGRPRVRALAAVLRRELESRGVAVREAGRRLELSHTTISQWLSGKRVPTVEDVSALLVAVGVKGRRREEILGLARNASDPNWLATGIPGIAQQLEGVVECERTANEIIEWCPMVMPGPLQTEDYARAIIGADDTLSRSEVDARVRLRLGRRDVLTGDRDHLGPADYTALIGEWGLKQRVGGASSLLAQLRQLVILAESQSIAILVVRVGDGWHPGLAGPFTLYNFDEWPSIVHLEHHRSGAFLYDENDIVAYKQAASVVRRVAMSPDDSVGFIAQMIDEMESGA